MRPPVGVVGADVALMLLTWPTFGPAPAAGLDPSWQGALHMAVHRDLAFGSDIVFTFGPLGFLKLPAFWYGDTGALAIGYRVLIRTALSALLFVSLRQSFGRIGAFLIALAVGSTIEEVAPVIVVLWGAWLLSRGEGQSRETTAFAVAIGALGGLEALGKLNTGATVLALGVVALLFLPRRGFHIAVLGAAAAVSLLVLWTVAGEPWNALDDYGRNAARIVSGYSSAMALDTPGNYWQYGAALVVFVTAVVAAWRTTGTALRDEARWGVLALLLALAFMSFKQGFVRHDETGATLFFGPMLGALCALRWPAAERAAGVVALALVFVAYLAAARVPLDDVIAPRHRLDAALDAAAAVVDGDRRARERAAGRAAIRKDAGLDAATLGALRGRSVHVALDETSVVWAYDLVWRPLPVFQSYTAYTPGLDLLNASRLESARGPDRVLYRDRGAIDNRWPAYDQPATTRVLLCRYRPVHHAPGWLVLARAADRCGAPRLTGSVRARWDQEVRVPQPSRRGAMVFVRIAGARPAGLERIRAALFKAYERSITFAGRDTRRLVAEVAGDGLIVWAGRGVDYPAPFAQSPQAPAIAVGRAKLGDASGTPLRFDFYEQPVRPWPATE